MFESVFYKARCADCFCISICTRAFFERAIGREGVVDDIQRSIYCKIAKGEIHSATVYEDSHFTVILDVNPATKGHCLIIPKEHFDNIYDLDGENQLASYLHWLHVSQEQ